MEAGVLAAPLIAFVIAAASPGPATLATAATAMTRGRRAGLVLGLGLTLGLSFWGALTALGLGALIIAFAPALLALKIAGGLYLLYLAWQSARRALIPGGGDPGGRPVTARNLLWRGFALNLMNPKAILAWAAAIAVGLPAEGAQTYLLAVVLLCSVITVGIYAAYALLFSIAAVRSAYDRARRWFEAAFALGFGLAGLRLLIWRSGAG